MDKKGIFVFLAVTLALSWIVQIIGIFTAMWVSYLILATPAVGAYVARKASRQTEAHSAAWPLPKAAALRIAIVTPLVFAVIYTATSLAGLTRPDWDFKNMMFELASTAEASGAAALQMEGSGTLFPVLAIIFTLVLGPTLVAGAVFGIEYGWRGYLLPRLMPLGRWPAYGLTGLAWGLSMAPMHMTGKSHSALAQLVLFLGVMLALSVILGELWRRSHHIGLTAVFYGTFVMQQNGFLPFLFPESGIEFPWGGTYGVVSLAAWVVVAAFPVFFFGRIGKAAEAKVLTPAK